MPDRNCDRSRAAVVALVAEAIEFFSYVDALDEEEEMTNEQLAEHIIGLLEHAGYVGPEFGTWVAA